MAIEVRELKEFGPGHLDEIANVAYLAFRRPPWNSEYSHEDWKMEIKGLVRTADKNEGKLFVASDGSKIVGFSIGARYNNSGSGKAPKTGKVEVSGKPYEFVYLAVHPDYQRRRVGQKLSEVREQHARELRCNSVVSQTLDNNHFKIRQFEKQGFRLLDRVNHNMPMAGGHRWFNVYHKEL